MPAFVDDIDASIQALEAQIEALPEVRHLLQLRQLKEKHLTEIKQLLREGEPSTMASCQVKGPLNLVPIEKQEDAKQTTPTTVIIKI